MERGENWNAHHVWFERRDYRTNLEKRLRRHRGFVIPVTVASHEALHRELQPPHKPTNSQIFRLLGILDCKPGDDRLHNLRTAASLFDELAHHSTNEMRQNAGAIAENLDWQIYHLADGYDYDNPVGKLVYPLESDITDGRN